MRRRSGLASLPGRDRAYSYDGLDRLTLALQGSWTGSTLDVDAPGSQEWGLDLLGNWFWWGIDANSDGVFGSDLPDIGETRTHNLANEILDRTPTKTGGVTRPYTHDAAGNLATAQRPSGSTTSYKHDAWNRLVQVSLGGIVIAEYEYNGLHQRTVKRADTTLPFDALDEQRHFYYSASWQLLHEDIHEDFLAAPTTIDRIGQQFWGIRYIDDAICRRLDRTTGPGPGGGGPDGVYDDTYYFITDAQYNTVGLLDDANGLVIERVTYTPYGVARHHRAGDLDGDGAVTSADQALAIAGKTIGDPDYNVDADLNRDGIVNVTDQNLVGPTPRAALRSGWISNPDPASGPDNPIGYAGYVFNPETLLSTVRFRTYDPEMGRWLERDPLGYVDGMSLYEYLSGQPSRYADWTGLSPELDRLILTFDRARDCLKTRKKGDEDAVDLFLDTQRCILARLNECTDECGAEMEQEVSDWIDAVSRDFMRPLVSSLNERCWGLAISDEGWLDFWRRYDSNELDGRNLIRWYWDLAVFNARLWTFVPQAPLNEDDFLVLGGHEVAHAMAMNHINNDLRRALENNGVGWDPVWDCIGGIVSECQDKHTNWVEDLGSWAGRKAVPALDVQRIRDEMREDVRRELQEESN